MTTITLRALAAYEARQRLLRYEREHEARMRGYEREWAHAEALREQDVRRTGQIFRRWHGLLQRLAS